MREQLRREFYGSKVSVGDRPRLVPSLLVPAWRVPLVALMVARCRTARAKREQLVVLNWALRDPVTHAALTARLAGKRTSKPPSVRYEPALVRAINIAHGLGLLTRESEWLTLSDDGRALTEQIAETGVYERERALLGDIGRPLPLNAAQEILMGGSA